MNSQNYNHQAVEKKWQDIWAKQEEEPESSPKKKYYVLEMFPYPSGRIHMGHVRNYVIGDALARHKRKQGYKVLHPMGWDSFGLPAENAARTNEMHPNTWTEDNIRHMREELKNLGLSIDWSREIATHTPEYYTQQQKLFILLWQNGLVVRKNSWINWDPVDQTVLANEQVVDGRGWRSGALVQKRMLPQWFFKITDFAEDLLQDAAKLKHWPRVVINMQRNWIGKSTGAVINFRSVERPDIVITVYSTRPETLFGATYVSIAPEHPLVDELQSQNATIREYIQSQPVNRLQQSSQTTGIFTGLHVQHPITSKILPVFINSGVAADYATGATFACPAHDQSDMDFAKLFNLPCLTVIQSPQQPPKDGVAYTETVGQMINSSFLNDLPVLQARQKMITYLQEHNLGEPRVNYRLRDWGISRQRSWGCPIPMICCTQCQYLPDHNPVLMPKISHWCDEEIKTIKAKWQQTTCPKCHQPAQRETDTMDTFVDSAWYFLRFCSPLDDAPINPGQAQKYMPVDYYIGGIEHAILHLLYARFMCKALRKCNLNIPTEPFQRLFTQGMICHPTYKNQDNKWLYPHDIDWSNERKPVDKATGQEVIVGKSEAMSKSKCNIVAPSSIIKQYGTDALRWFILADTPPERNMEWSDAKMQTSAKYLTKIWQMSLDRIPHICTANPQSSQEFSAQESKLCQQMQKIFKEALEHLEKLRLNSYIAQIYTFTNLMTKVTACQTSNRQLTSMSLQYLCHLLSPITPHLAAEIWHRCNFSKDDINTIPWPTLDTPWETEKTYRMAVQVNGKVKLVLTVAIDKDEAAIVAQAKQELKHKNASLNPNQARQIIYVPKQVINFVL